MPIEQALLMDIQNNDFREQTLELDQKELTNEDVFLLVEALKHNHYIEHLNVENNFISSLGAQNLATLTNLEVLDISGNRIGPEGALALAKSRLKELNIISTHIGDSIAAFASSPFLVTLNAAACSNLTDAGVAPLFSSKSIKDLDLSENELSSQCLKHIVSNTTLKILNFSQNKDDKDCCYYIAQNSHLKSVDLANIFIEDEGAILLAKSTSLKNLFLRGCCVGDKGAFALSQNNHLNALSLYQNKITETGAKAFIHNTTLTHLNLEENPFNALNVKELENFYKKRDEKTYVRTKQDIEILLKKKEYTLNLARVNSLSNRFKEYKNSGLTFA